MIRVVCVVLGTLLLIARVCILGFLAIATAGCACYSLYWLMRHGGLPDVSIAELHPGAYEYLLPPRYIVLNTLYIFCLRLPLLISLCALFLLAMLLDRLGQALFRRLAVVLRADKTI